MNLRSFRAVLVALSMLFASGAAYLMTPPDRSGEPLTVSLEKTIPESFGEWHLDRSVVPVTMSADVESALYSVYDAVLGRTYVNGQGQRVMLSIGYSRQQGGVQKPHWQEICYRAQGFKVTELKRGTATVAGRSIPVTRMVATQGNRTEPVTYWLTLGEHVVKDRTDRLVRLLGMGLTGETTDGYLMRVSSISAEAGPAYDMQLKFAEALLGAVSAEQRRRLVGAD